MNFKMSIVSSFSGFRQTPSRVQIFRNFYGVQNPSQRQLPYEFNEKADVSLFFTNLPSKKREKKVKNVEGPLYFGNLIIDCKNKNINHYVGMQYGKFDVVPLASKGWKSRKAVGDYFSILPKNWHTAFVTKENLPVTFQEVGVSDEVLQQLQKINVTHPTVIQVKSIQKLLEGKNLFMFAENGSGKTLGYLIALMQNILKWKKIQVFPGKLNAPLGIVLTPTRELALQIGQLAQMLAADLDLKCQILLGGHIQNLWERPKFNAVDILVCTLRVLKKNVEMNLYSTELCKHLVVDEADSFMESNYLHEIRSFLNRSRLQLQGLRSSEVTPMAAQVCFVSSVFSNELYETLTEFLKENEVEEVSTPHVNKVNRHVRQDFWRVNKEDRLEKLLKILNKNKKQNIPTMIFCNKLSTQNWLTSMLEEQKVDFIALDGGKFSNDRLMNFRDSWEGVTNFFCCTDLASRGLEFPKLKQVVNFEFPSFMIDYIHRCGRIGRISQKGPGLITNFISSGFEISLTQNIELAVRRNTTLPKIHINRVVLYNKLYKNK